MYVPPGIHVHPRYILRHRCRRWLSLLNVVLLLVESFYHPTGITAPRGFFSVKIDYAPGSFCPEAYFCFLKNIASLP